MISWLRRAASKRSCVTSIHAMPCRSIFSTSMATKISRKSRSKPTNGSSSRARSQPHSSRRKNATRFAIPPDNSVGYLFNIARSQPDFRRQRDDFAFIGFVHKNSDILHRGQVFRQAVFLKQKTRFAESIAYRARFRRFQAFKSIRLGATTGRAILVEGIN